MPTSQPFEDEREAAHRDLREQWAEAARPDSAVAANLK
jgi:hypothetical protein